MRDALSLLDQAISFCNGEIQQQKVKEMLGVVDSEEVYALITAIVDSDASNIQAIVKNLYLSENNAEAVLDRIAEIWFSSCVYHFTQNIDSSNDIALEIIENILSKIDPQQIHFLYQLTISAKKDINLAPNFETGVTMAILRLIAFQKKNLNDSSESFSTPIKNNISKIKQDVIAPIIEQKIINPIKIESQPDNDLDQKWFNLLNKIKLKGFTKTFAFNSHLTSFEDNVFNITINDDASKILELDGTCATKLEQIIAKHLDKTETKIVISRATTLTKEIMAEIKPNISPSPKTPSEIKRNNALDVINKDKNVSVVKDILGLELKDENIILKN
jgi:DNA polymerase-3 subunit gamma/tau